MIGVFTPFCEIFIYLRDLYFTFRSYKRKNGEWGGEDVWIVRKVKGISLIVLEIHGYKDFIDNFYKFTA